MMGIEVLEPVPARNVPYELSDPYILVHEATVPINPERAKLDTTHPHRGFDNLWYILSGDASTGHSTGPGGTFERARLGTGGLLKIRTGRGVRARGEHRRRPAGSKERPASSGRCRSGSTSPARTSMLSPPRRSCSRTSCRAGRMDGANERTLVGPGSPVELGTPGLILDVELPEGRWFDRARSPPSSTRSCGCSKAKRIGANARSARRSQIAVLGPGSGLGVTNAVPGTRFMLMAGKPYREDPERQRPIRGLNAASACDDRLRTPDQLRAQSLTHPVDELATTMRLASLADERGSQLPRHPGPRLQPRVPGYVDAHQLPGR